MFKEKIIQKYGIMDAYINNKKSRKHLFVFSHKNASRIGD